MCQTSTKSFFFAALAAIGLSLSSGLAACCLAQLPTIEVSSFSLPAGQVGSTIGVQVRGNRLDELAALIASAPGVISEERTTAPRLLEEQRSRTNQFDLTIAAECQPGLVELRAIGRFGISNPRRFLVTRKAIEAAKAEHTDIATAMPLPTDSIVVGQCVPRKRNYFSVNLDAGSRLDCVAYAEPIDSQASLRMVLLDAKGHELASGRSKGTWPAEIHREIETTAEHFVVIYDLLYRGGEAYPFVLEALVSSADSPKPANLELDQLLRPDVLLTTKSQADPTSALAPPFEVTGNLTQTPLEYEFKALKGQQFSIRVHSSGNGALTDPSLIVYKLDAANPAKPTQLAVQDDAAALGSPNVRIRQLDPALSWTAPEDASYRIAIHDNHGGDRPTDATEMTLCVKPLEPSFDLLAYRPFPTNAPAAARPFGGNLLRGGTEVIEVIAIRRDGFSGAIELVAEELPPGVSCSPVVLPAGGNNAALVLECSEDAPAWHGDLKIVGRGMDAERSLEVVARPVSISAPAMSTKNAVQHRYADNLMAAVNAKDVAPLLVELGDGSILEVVQGAKLSIPIKATRRAGGKAECTLRPKNLPPKTTLAETKIPADKTEAVAELSVAADAPVGEHTFWMQNETKVRFRPNPQALEREEAYLAKLKNAAETATDETAKQQLEAAIPPVNSRVEELKKLCAEQEFTVWLPTTLQRIRILPKP